MSDEIFDYLIQFEETLEIEATCTDFGTDDEPGGPITPDSHLIKLFKPDGTQSGIDATTPTLVGEEGSGVYTQRFPIPADGPDGIWTVKWVYDVSGEKKPARFRVKVVA